MVNKKVVIAVDKKFFDNLFEKERMKMQKKIGGINLSQANFTKMISGFKLKVPKQYLSGVKSKRGKKKNEIFMF